MPRIHKLSHEVVTKIAAGEVIERPASVVKEMLENSIDAGSTRIEIDLEAGGTELIRIVDDGCGIEPEDLPLVFASHATSKLRHADDLFRIGTLGFRGEAMASIGGVAQVRIQSRAVGAATGSELHCHGGELSPIRPWNGALGTRIEVKHLFYNVPVRRKFLKATATELGHVCETVTRLALAYPTLHLVLRHNNRLIHEIPASAGLTDRIGLFYGADVRDQLLDVKASTDRAALMGYIAGPDCDRGNAKTQHLFLNGRWIRDRGLAHAIQEAYRGLLMTGRFAVAFLYLEVPPDSVDVNVHPTKAEVRFRDSGHLFHLIHSTLRERLSRANLIPQLQIPRQAAEPENDLPTTPPLFTEARTDQPLASEVPSATEPLAERPNARLAATPPSPPAPRVEPTPSFWEPAPQAHRSLPSPSIVPPPTPAPTFATPHTLTLPPTGHLNAIQVHDSYLVVETPEGMLVIDQHALHERILFEQFRRRVISGTLDVQRLLIPQPVELLPDQAAALLEAREELRKLGLEVEEFGGSTVLLESYPVLFSRVPPTDLLKSVVDYMTGKDRPPTKEAFLHDLLATMACKAAVKAGDRLSPDEIAALMEQRKLADDSHHCPHGRPTQLLFSRHELEKQFKRI